KHCLSFGPAAPKGSREQRGSQQCQAIDTRAGGDEAGNAWQSTTRSKSSPLPWKGRGVGVRALLKLLLQCLQRPQVLKAFKAFKRPTIKPFQLNSLLRGKRLVQALLERVIPD